MVKVDLDEELVNKIKKIMENYEFDSIEEVIRFLVESKLSEMEEEKLIKERLKDLGYI